MPRFVIDVKDYRGERIVFTARKWKEKVKDHRELTDQNFLDSIPKTLSSPKFVYEDYHKPKFKRCYYKKYSDKDFTKVVIWNEEIPHKVITAFITNIIKEKRYKKLKIIYQHGQ